MVVDAPEHDIVCLSVCVYEEIEIIVEPPSITLRSGEDARFDCSARSNIDVEQIEWTREDGRLPHGNFHSSSLKSPVVLTL